jgi:TonB family protein
MLIAALAAASIASVQGEAVIRCRVQPSGQLSGCVVVSETPKGANVGAFALKLAKNYRVAPDDRRIRGGVITIPMQFKLPGAVP